MTKMVRIENADTSDHRIVVEVWDKGEVGTPDTLVRTVPLDYPTQMVSDVYVTSTRYLMVKERSK